MTGRIAAAQPKAAAGRAAMLAPALMAMLLGAFLVLGAGFAPLAAVHNAAHDARHALFPCH